MRVAAPQSHWDFWSSDVDSVLSTLESSDQGLASDQARERLEHWGENRHRDHSSFGPLQVLQNQLRSPLLSLLIFAAVVSLLTGQWVDASIVLTILTASVGIGFFREYRAQKAAALLQQSIALQSTVLRDGSPQSIPSWQLVQGDIVLLSAGSLIPADGRLIAAEHFFVNESVLTGESFPVEKRPGETAAGAGMGERTNCVFLGSNVRSGTGRFVVCLTGASTSYGGIAERLRLRPPETEFDRGLRRFGEVLAATMLIMVVVVLCINVLLGRPFIETLLFSIALAVGLSPELLPAILSVNLARGALAMSRHGVLVRRLNAIENLGSMDILCTDKTGTLTQGIVQLHGTWSPAGASSARVHDVAAMNAKLQAGYANPLDAAILEAYCPDLQTVRKRAEIPYDFIRKRLSVVIEDARGIRLVTKGAVTNVLQDCTRTSDGGPFGEVERQAAEALCEQWNREGIRVLAVASRDLPDKPDYSREDERELTLEGFATFLDHPKEGVAATISQLRAQGIAIKLISGDSRLVCSHVAREVGLPADNVLTGAELDELPEPALWNLAERTDLFVEVDPNQKERIILALKKMGHVVGFLGDGVNDAPAMHAADTSLSVDQAVDVAREAADFVLLERDLASISLGIVEGRTTFANTLKYILMTASANLGNMMSMAVASLMLPFLPLLAGQVLLNNFLSDIPAFALGEDTVDPEMISKPRRWNMRLIVTFMVEFGLLSSLFDALTFLTLLFVFHSGPELFRTGWFVESLITELAVSMVVRTWRPCYSSRPAVLWMISVLLVAAIAFAIPYMPVAAYLGFVPLPVEIVVAIIGIAAAYVATAEMLKRTVARHGGENVGGLTASSPPSGHLRADWRTAHQPAESDPARTGE